MRLMHMIFERGVRMRLVGVILILFSTVGGILYNIDSCNRWIKHFIWKDIQVGVVELSNLGGSFHHKTLNKNEHKKSYDALLKIIKSNAPEKSYEGVRGIESKTGFSYSTYVNQKRLPLTPVVSLLYENSEKDNAVATLNTLKGWVENYEASWFFRWVLAVFLLGFLLQFIGQEIDRNRVKKCIFHQRTKGIIKKIKDCINVLSPLITAFATVALVLVTTKYVHLLHDQTALQQKPVVKISSGLWNIEGEESGVFELELCNTGVSDISNIRIFEDCFVPTQDNPLMLGRVGAYTVIEDQKIDYLEKKKCVPFKIKFDHLLEQMQEVLKTKEGNQYKIFRIKIKFDRDIDKEEFETEKVYIVTGNNNILLAEDERDSAGFQAVPIKEIKRILGIL